MKGSILLSLFLLLFLCACQKEDTGGSSSSPSNQTANREGAAAQFTFSQPTAQKEVSEDGQVIHKATATGFLAGGIWHCGGKLASSKFDGDHNGLWIKFEDDGSFSQGHYNQQERQGRWAYGEEQDIIELIYDNEPSRLYGYRIQHGSNAMIFLGHPRYETNPTQMKWERFQNYPLPLEGKGKGKNEE